MIFTLPPGFRPAEVTSVATTCITLGAISAALVVTGAGEVRIFATGGDPQNVCEDEGGTVLDGV